MKVYHGSYIEETKANIKYSRDTVDFGKGFYLTPIYQQAQNWSLRLKKLGKSAIVSTYNLEDDVLKLYKVKEFKAYTEEWLDFIVACRALKDKSDYDIIIGGVADDKVFNTIELFLDNLIDKKEALKRLRYEKPNMQICIRNQKILDKHLKYEGRDKL